MRRRLPAGEPTASQMFLPETKCMFWAGEICLQSGCKEECCLACSGSPLARLLPGQCPSCFPPLCWEHLIPQEKSEFLSCRLCGSPCLLAWSQGDPIPARGLLADSAPAPSLESIPTISPALQFPSLFASSPNQQQTISPFCFLFRSWSCLCLPKDGKGEAGEVPNWDHFEMGFTTSWISQMWSPECTGAAVCTARTAARLAHQPPHQFSLSAFTLNIPSPLRGAVPWWLVRPCHNLNVSLAGCILKSLAGASVGSWQEGAGTSLRTPRCKMGAAASSCRGIPPGSANPRGLGTQGGTWGCFGRTV